MTKSYQISHNLFSFKSYYYNIASHNSLLRYALPSIVPQSHNNTIWLDFPLVVAKLHIISSNDF